MIFEFIVTCSVPDYQWDVIELTNQLCEAGCDDALIFSGIRGTLALEFDREASSAREAISSAIENIKEAIPDAEVLEVKPDLVNLSDIAEMVGQSRQNIRKLANFPSPALFAGSSPLWNLYQIIKWYEARGGDQPFQESVAEIAKNAWEFNLMLGRRRLEKYA